MHVGHQHLRRRADLDAGQLETVLLTFVRNAADAMPEGGPLTIRTRAAEWDGSEPDAVEIEDQGTGMPADVSRPAIEPFFAPKPKGKGDGFGLSMVNGFTEQSGGRMAVASEPSRGTTVTLGFPVKEPPPR